MKKMQNKKSHIDRSETFDEFLDKEGLLAETEDAALKEIIADQLTAAMRRQKLTKTDMAARMRTSRRQLDRLLDPKNPSVTLSTLRRAATALGRNLRVELELRDLVRVGPPALIGAPPPGCALTPSGAPPLAPWPLQATKGVEGEGRGAGTLTTEE